VNATAVSVGLQIYLCALKYTNKLSDAVAGETVAELTTSLSLTFYPLFFLLFYFFV
jgi:hypothetical protein